MEKVQYKITSPVGPLYLVASANALNGVYFVKQAFKSLSKLDLTRPECKILQRAAQQLKEYFAGQRKRFDITYDLDGTIFQKQVWAQLAKIPFGTTVSYRDIARRIKNPKAVRAVGSANGKNPVCIMVPCHRVISADGTIGGYSGGLPTKRKLLQLEAVKGF